MHTYIIYYDNSALRVHGHNFWVYKDMCSKKKEYVDFCGTLIVSYSRI